MARRQEVVVRSMSGSFFQDLVGIGILGWLLAVLLCFIVIPGLILCGLYLFVRWCYRRNKVRLARKRGEPIPTWTTRKERLAKKADEQRIAQLMREEQRQEHDRLLREEAARRLRG